MMGEVSLEKSPENIMIQDRINSENSMNTTESTNTNIFKILNVVIIMCFKQTSRRQWLEAIAAA